MVSRPDGYNSGSVILIWAVDSFSREGFDCSSGEWEPVTEFAIKDSPIRMSIAELDLP